MNTAASLVNKDHFIEKNKTVRNDLLPAKRKVRYLEDLHRANESDNSSYNKRLPLKNAGIKLSPPSLILLFKSLICSLMPKLFEQ